jgi:hypothetical protein
MHLDYSTQATCFGQIPVPQGMEKMLSVFLSLPLLPYSLCTFQHCFFLVSRVHCSTLQCFPPAPSPVENNVIQPSGARSGRASLPYRTGSWLSSWIFHSSLSQLCCLMWSHVMWLFASDRLLEHKDCLLSPVSALQPITHLEAAMQ